MSNITNEQVSLKESLKPCLSKTNNRLQRV